MTSDPHGHDAAIRWSLLGLTAVTGVVDAVSFLGLGHIFTANMTGNIVFLGFAIGGGTGVSVARSLAALSAFACGGICGGRLSTRDVTPARLLLTAMCFESLLLLLAVVSAAQPGFHVSSVAYVVIASTALAMGLRNAVVRKLAVPDLTTTVLTLTVTGLAGESRFAGGKGDRSGTRILSITAMCVGAAGGAVLLGRFGLEAALAAAALSVAGLSLFLYSSLRHRSAERPSPAAANRGRRRWPVALALLVLSGCAPVARPRTDAARTARESSTTVLLHGKPLELHITAPPTPVTGEAIVLYASGDGGWFGAAVDMYRQIGKAGYAAVGFSSRAFLRSERPRGALVSAAQLAGEYDLILSQARRALGLDATSRAVLTGWSRGAAFAVLVASEPAPGDPVLGVVAIGLAEGEDLQLDGDEDDTDDGQESSTRRRWPFDTYGRIARLGPLPCAVIQATHDNCLPAPGARQLFGPDTPTRRFYTIEARNHRFSGGEAAFDAAFLDAIRWVVSRPVRLERAGEH